MKPKILLSLSILTLTAIKAENSFAVVKFADKKIEENIMRIYDRYPLIKQQLDQLSLSELTYVIRYGNDEKQYDAIFETDGQVLFMTFRKEKGFSYSLQVCVAHEATHALQFEKGQIGFRQNKDGNWHPVNIDLWDEAEAFKTSLEVATPGDIGLGDLGTFKMKYETEGFENAVKWLSRLYPTLSDEHENNPDVTHLRMVEECLIKMGYKLYCKAYQSYGIAKQDNGIGQL